MLGLILGTLMGLMFLFFAEPPVPKNAAFWGVLSSSAIIVGATLALAARIDGIFLSVLNVGLGGLAALVGPVVVGIALA